MAARPRMTEQHPDANPDILLSVVIPALNEGESLAELHREVIDACERCREADPAHRGYEVIIVDDGSTDDTPDACASLSPLRYIRHEHNLGQTAALDRGIHESRGTYIATLDGDGQNDPADIPTMLSLLVESDLDCVCGWRVNRKDALAKRIASRGAYVLRQLLVRDRIHDSGCTLKVFRRACFDGIHLQGGQHRFIPAILKAHGYSVGEVPVNHRMRTHGVSKYDASRFAEGLRDLIAIRRATRGRRP